ncbi:hypothetical protein RSOLAG1IB_02926 [Rhizoctonia solani AG-1 IB]|uniref:Uncharacterized protein n=1 Tax=Thanatephorus cucumeris (strain AG1-IB / isolate 7/3/14) TaxID=1108050 RepID=A0A0B7FJN0_THACB|nr:hypothetical protein RSOLAG1IB_02926 [Rhizoctonia solani AG-1 IB]
MDALDLDTSYCIVCNQFIWPERYQVSIDAPAPVSPTVDPSTLRASKKPVARTTRPNPQRKQTQPPLRRNASTRKTPTLPTLEAAIETSATKLRTVISQSPSPIYCSDACRSHDVESGNRAETSLKTLFDPSYSPCKPSPISPLISGSESDMDTDHSNAGYFARLVPRRPWLDRRMSGASTVSMSSSSSASSGKDYLYENRRRARAYLAESAARLNRSDSPCQSALPRDQPEVAPVLPPVPERPAAVPFTHRRFKESSHHAMPLPLPIAPDASELYASYPLSVRTRSEASVKRDPSPSALSSSLPESGTERTPTPSVYDLPLCSSLSAEKTKGLLVRPVLIRSESASTMSPLSGSWDGDNILESLRNIQLDSKPRVESRRSRKPMSKTRMPKNSNAENRRTQATSTPDEVGPTYPVLQLPRPKKIVVKTIIAREVLRDGTERLVERKVTEEVEEEPKKLFTFLI